MTEAPLGRWPGFEMPANADPARAAARLGPLQLEPLDAASTAVASDIPPPLYAAGEIVDSQPENKTGTTALLLALGALVTLLSSQGLFFFVALPAGLTATVIGIIGLKEQRRNEQTKGRWMSIVGISIGLLAALASMAVALLVIALIAGLVSDLPGNF